MAPAMAHFSDAYVASEPISANKEQASRPYCNTATARLGVSVAVAISQINQADVTALISVTLGTCYSRISPCFASFAHWYFAVGSPTESAKLIFPVTQPTMKATRLPL
jgi:hypothetical protein